jgi:hypothetical protein
MPRVIQPIPTKGPYTVQVTVVTGDGEKRNDATISEVEMAVGTNMEDLLAYQAAKAAKRSFRTICRSVVKRAHPELKDGDKELDLIWRATICGRDLNIHTQEEFVAMQSYIVSRRYHLSSAWAQIGYAWVGVYMAIYELWRAIRG